MRAHDDRDDSASNRFALRSEFSPFTAIQGDDSISREVAIC